MKREALSESETGLNDDSLMPLCEDMLRCRQEDMDRVNAMFGTNIQVYLDSSWLENEIERIISLRSQAQEASSQLENPAPLETGMEDISIEGVSKQEASQLGGDESEEDGENNGGEDPGDNDTSIDEDNDSSSEDPGKMEDGVEDEEVGKTLEEEEDDSGREFDDRDGGEESGEVTVDIDININGEEVESKEEDGIEEDSKEEDRKEEESKEEDSKEEEEDKEDGNDDSSED
jgi:hypothetical protein